MNGWLAGNNSISAKNYDKLSSNSSSLLSN